MARNTSGWAFTIERDTWGGQSEPRQLELFVSDGNRITLIESGILLEENKDYFLSAAFAVNADARFYVKDLATATVQVSNVEHSMTVLRADSNMDIIAPYGFSRVDGIIDEVRLSRGILPTDELLVNLAGSNGLQAGDADMNLEFNQLDLVKVQIAAKYLSGQAATWGEGDWDGAPGGEPGNPPQGNGLFDQLDIIAALGANTYLKGRYDAILPGGAPGDGQTSITYDVSTGEVGVDGPAGTNLTSVNIDSASGIFTGDAAQNLGGSFDNDADNNIFKATFGSSFGSLSFGNVAQAGLSEDFVAGDLTVVGSLAGGGDLGAVDLIYVPEPPTIALLGLAMLGALVLRRRQ